MTSENIVLDCPYCREAISRPLPWFKNPYFSCPMCKNGLAAGQFASMVDDIEQALDGSIEEMVHGEPVSGCCGGGSSCR